MDDAQKVTQNLNPTPATPPVSVDQSVNKASTASDIPMAPVGSVQKEQEPIAVSEVVKPTETAPEISPEVAPFVAPSQPTAAPVNQIIKATGDITPVPSEPSGIVHLPTIKTMEEALPIRKTDGPTNGIRWQAEERIREELRDLDKTT